DTTTTPKQLKLIEGGRLDPTAFATHHFALADAEQAYDVFAAAAETHALKVVLTAVPAGHELPASEEELVGVGEHHRGRSRSGRRHPQGRRDPSAAAPDARRRHGGARVLRPPLGRKPRPALPRRAPD